MITRRIKSTRIAAEEVPTADMDIPSFRGEWYKIRYVSGGRSV
jgi:hypothetical protein